jgi:hypothetical protein
LLASFINNIEFLWYQSPITSDRYLILYILLIRTRSLTTYWMLSIKFKNKNKISLLKSALITKLSQALESISYKKELIIFWISLLKIIKKKYHLQYLLFKKLGYHLLYNKHNQNNFLLNNWSRPNNRLKNKTKIESQKLWIF